jgi:hypothetical protein
MSKEDFFVQVTMTAAQARTVVRALDVYMRIHLGQFNIIREQFMGKDIPIDQVEHHLFKARALIFPQFGEHRGASHGIGGNCDPDAQVAFDVLQVIRQRESLGRHPEGGITVNFDSPHWVSDSTPRPVARNINVLERLADLGDDNE